jgi:hypothetical protein
MAKKNPFDDPPKPKPQPVMRPDADLKNADWPKWRRKDVDVDGSYITPVVQKNRK